MRRIAQFLLLLLPFIWPPVSLAQGAPRVAESNTRLKRVETELEEAQRLLHRLQALVESLKGELNQLREETAPSPHGRDSRREATAAISRPEKEGDAYSGRILGIDLGKDERKHEATQRPEIFLQARYSTWPHAGASIEDIKSNFRLSRIETRWAGRIGERIGAGLEVQYHPAPDGSAEELVNDAFMEYYVNDHATLRVGQFVKPFGFDIQQSSSVREYPERAIFAGYFFPGQRDRGVLLLGDLDFLDSPALQNVDYSLGVFNGNRFFTDSNRQLNYLLRLRKHFESLSLAVGGSAQLGRQLLPQEAAGSSAENIFGLDLQYALGRFGLRGEFVAGNMPSTLLGLTPEFAPAFRAGRHASGGAIAGVFQISGRDSAYVRYDRFNGDPVTGGNVRAVNFGYLRLLGKSARVGLDYQFKNRLSFNDDAVNTRLQMTWGVLF